jgi:hypothetical protein
MGAPRYRPLDASRDEIRLLSVVHDDTSNAVRCTLQYFPLLSSPPYVALSYAWREPSTREGETLSKETVLVDDRHCSVTMNLALALRTLRVETLCIWVDALCIDQSNTAERSAQVAIMRKIYEHAKKVVVWLGPEKGESTLALDFIELIAEQATKPHFLAWLMNTAKGGLHEPEWTAFRNLFERGWWTRTWAVQEFILGKEVDFVCGQRIMAAKKLEQALGQAYHYGLSLSKLLRDRHAICFNTRTLRNIITLMSCRNWTERGKSLPLLPILNVVNWTSCSDPRDKVYGILGVVTDPAIASISPDYSLPTHEVYRKLVKSLIESNMTLDILGFIKSSNIVQGLPGWVPDWSVTSVRWPLSQRVRGSASVRTDYCAAKSIAASTFFSPDSSVLTCRGVLIDEVDGISVATTPESPSEIGEVQPRLSANAYGEDVDLFDAMWRTFVGDASYPEHPDMEAPLTFRPLFARKCLKVEVPFSADDQDSHRQMPSLGIDNDTLGTWYRDVRGFKIAGKRLSSILLDHGKPYAAADIPVSAHVSFAFEQSIQIMQSGRRLITTTTGYIGLAPSGVKRGDKVCVLLGCHVPLILRPMGDHFQVIGDAYIHGVMHGEAVDGVRGGTFTLRDFHLC